MARRTGTDGNDSVDPSRVDEIVRLVLARLTSMTNATTPPTDIQEPTDAAELDQRVISADLIHDLRPAARRIWISSTAVVTPAAIDEARARGIQLERKQNEAKQELTITDSQQPQRAASVARQISRRGVSGDARIVLSDTPSIDVYHSCRDGRVAVMVAGPEDVARFEQEISPATWVLDMKRLSLIGAVNAAVRILKLPKTN